ncbi:Serine/threonine-protein kinase ulk3 [Tyrophagus putrescentiae]|nr:Serine/threonine-protein kinase ulk3 [Tyrophagus putrescentiae]
MGDDLRKSAEYENALKKFLAEEDERRKKFEGQLADRAQQMQHFHVDTMKISKTRIEAEIARKKIAIDEAFKTKCNQLWADCNAKMKALEEKTAADIENMIKEKAAKLEQKIVSITAFHKGQIEARREAFNNEVARLEEALSKGMLDEENEEDRRQFLKRELVEFKRFPDTPTIVDEDGLRRLGIQVKKVALASSREYIIYRASCPRGECILKVVVLSERHSKYRANLPACSKVQRYLMDGGPGTGAAPASAGPAQPRHAAFIALHHFFISPSKSYCFMEEVSTASLDALVKTAKMAEAQLPSVLLQVLAGLEFMHTRAIAHLNLRSESVLFSKTDPQQVKIGGLGYAEHYFNADTETFFKLAKVDRRREYLPAECYLEETFDPPPVDVYSLGFLLYAAVSDMRKKPRQKKIAHIELANLPEGPGRDFVKETCARAPGPRPKLAELKDKPFLAGARANP